MQYLTPNFTKEMMKDYTVLIPSMAPIQFRLIKAALESEGYHRVEMISSGSPDVMRLGLKYVHNDTCYPALLIIGQFLEALESGKYDLSHTALIISQSGGGCRASNYIRLLRKALVNAGYGNIPVGSANLSGLEKGSRMPYTLRLLIKLIAAVEYGDLLMALRNQTAPYEVKHGESEEVLETQLQKAEGWFRRNQNCGLFRKTNAYRSLIEPFSKIEVKRVPKVKVGVVGEIFVKFSPDGNNHLQDLLESQGCEVNFPGLMGYIEYCVANMILDTKLYGMKPSSGRAARVLLSYLDHDSKIVSALLKEHGYYAPGSFRELMEKPDGILGLGAKMGEGWLLTAEMVELIQGGYTNIVCAQPFGCLPNHIAGKGVVNRIRERFPHSCITPVDYDPSASKVNQENRIKLMLAVGKEELEKQLEMQRNHALQTN